MDNYESAVAHWCARAEKAERALAARDKWWTELRKFCQERFGKRFRLPREERSAQDIGRLDELRRVLAEMDRLDQEGK